jgi:hypothetical protein
LRALALAPLAAVIRIRPPEVLNFGVLVAGHATRHELEIFNDGDATLEIAAPRIEADPRVPGAFAIASPNPMSIPPRGSGAVTLEFAPPANGAVRYDAHLVLESNDPQHPRSELRLVGFASAPGTLLVTPTAIQFNPSPIEANLPQLPPGLPPTVHRGSTRATTIYNTGTGSLNILAASFQILAPDGMMSPQYWLWNTDGSAVTQTNKVLRSGESLTLVVEFLPIEAGQHDATLQIMADDPTQAAITVTIIGQGVL